jgi:hypothetical protein
VSGAGAPVGSVRPALDFCLDEARRRLSAPGRRILVLTDGVEGSDAGEVSGAFDAAWIAPTRLEGLDVHELGRVVAAVLRPGAPLACVVPGCRPLSTVLERALLGQGDLPSARRARLEGGSVPCLSAAAWRKAFGPEFSWHRLRGVGILVPARSAGIQVERRALVLGLLAAAEHVVGGWPILRGLGDRLLLEGVRR